MACLQRILNYSTYPIADPNSFQLQEVIECARSELKTNGIALLPNFMKPEAILETINDAKEVMQKAYRGISNHNVYLEECDEEGLDGDHPKMIALRSSKTCITDDQINAKSPLKQLYLSPEMTAFIGLLLEKEVLYRTADFLGALNIQFYESHDQLNWHFDRAEFAVTLLLQAPQSGGNFQYIPSTRSDADENYDLVKQVLLDSRARRDLTSLGVKTAYLQPGTLVIFCGHNSIHRVTPVNGNGTRILAVLSYEQRPNVHLNEYTRLKFFGRLK